MVVVTAGPGGAHKVLLISGKQSSGGLARSVSVVLPASAHPASDSDSSATAAPLRKRQRLTHLSPEEKALRRKLKNRVAAQTARDRKKAKMGELEQQVLELEQENQKLHVENQMLVRRTSELLSENEELRERLGLHTLHNTEKVQSLESRVCEKVCEQVCEEEECDGDDDDDEDEVRVMMVGSSESAALRLRVPPQQVQTQQPARPSPTASWSDLLLGILDILDSELFLKSHQPEELQEDPEDPEESLPASSPGALGATPGQLEALNELIQFDHIYTRAVEAEPEEEEVEPEEEEAGLFSVIEDIEVETVSVKEEPEMEEGAELEEPEMMKMSEGAELEMKMEDLLSYLPGDAHSDSGYEGSPFSHMSSSPLMSPQHCWDDDFANELFPQLISV